MALLPPSSLPTLKVPPSLPSFRVAWVAVSVSFFFKAFGRQLSPLASSVPIVWHGLPFPFLLTVDRLPCLLLSSLSPPSSFLRPPSSVLPHSTGCHSIFFFTFDRLPCLPPSSVPTLKVPPSLPPSLPSFRVGLMRKFVLLLLWDPSYGTGCHFLFFFTFDQLPCLPPPSSLLPCFLKIAFGCRDIEASLKPARRKTHAGKASQPERVPRVVCRTMLVARTTIVNVELGENHMGKTPS
ncbi:hypothetical protein ACN38_g3857 [Penicillium nordicum]|uniref:Uncharacterized protein n=1 Tax=Penicillium nordicum TaxID=229535 RepID=A0A0M8PD44_9EURO|nr:hypothetical protein ACN38_g3857 [Penicillium nordicum]